MFLFRRDHMEVVMNSQSTGRLVGLRICLGILIFVFTYDVVGELGALLAKNNFGQLAKVLAVVGILPELVIIAGAGALFYRKRWGFWAFVAGLACWGLFQTVGRGNAKFLVGFGVFAIPCVAVLALLSRRAGLLGKPVGG
jgi:hypothetical protein